MTTDSRASDTEGGIDVKHGVEPSARDRVPLNCMKSFDRMYYCYSPFYQGRQYYMTGELDDCKGRVREFRMCLMSRLRNQDTSEQLFEAEERRDKAKQAAPVWQMRDDFVARIAELDRAERERRQDENARADAELEHWWK